MRMKVPFDPRSKDDHPETLLRVEQFHGAIGQRDIS